MFIIGYDAKQGAKAVDMLGASSYAIPYTFDSAGESEALAKAILVPGSRPQEIS